MKENKIISALLKGNAHFIEGNQTFLNLDEGRRKELVSGQKPKAIILSCSDSRVPPELLFNQGLGDLFIVRIAGNIVCKTVLESIEYAVSHLKIEPIVVLGHTSCGAISSAIEAYKNNTNADSAIFSKITPAIKACQDNSEDFVNSVARKNVELTAKEIIETSSVISSLINENKVNVFSAFYDLESGKVEIL